MSLARAASVLFAATLVSLTLSWLIGQSQAQDPEEPSGEASIGIEWEYQPKELGDLVSESPAVVLAEVSAISDGDPILVAEDASFPTQLIELQVVETIEGEVPGEFTLFKIGDEADYSGADPPYEVGQRYLLFVRPRLNDEGTGPNPDGSYLAVAPEGRFEKVGGELESVVDGAVPAELEGLTVPEAEEAIEEAEE